MNTSGLSWTDAQTFLAVAEHRSFSGAARVLEVGQPTISRRIQNLERRVSAQLFTRGKYGAEPTAAALRLLPAAEQMAKWAAEFGRAANGSEQSVAGVVKVAAPPGIAVEQLAPFAASLKPAFPDLQLEVYSSISHMDLTRGGADIAIRTQFPGEPELVALHEIKSRPTVRASKVYAATLKQPCGWADIDWVTWTGQYRHVAPRPILERLIPDFSPVFSSDDYLVQKAAVTAGLGAMITNKPMGAEQSELVDIDIGVSLPENEIYIVCARSMQQVPRIRVVIDAMLAHLEESA